MTIQLEQLEEQQSQIQRQTILEAQKAIEKASTYLRLGRTLSIRATENHALGISDDTLLIEATGFLNQCQHLAGSAAKHLNTLLDSFSS